MHITVEPRDECAILHLRGEFDTHYVPDLQQEINGLIEAGVVHVVLNLRLVKFINSTALGAILKTSELLHRKGGRLVISRPSAFVRDIAEKTGLDRVVAVVDSDEAAEAELKRERSASKSAGSRQVGDEDASSVLFALVDEARLDHFLGGVPSPPSSWRGVGRLSGLDEAGLSFVWSGDNTGLSAFAMAQMLAPGIELVMKFRLPLLKRGDFEARGRIQEVEERAESVKIRVAFLELDPAVHAAVRQYAVDMAFLKEELRKAAGT